MADVIYVAVIIGFFVLAAAYVTACDRIIGADPDELSEGGEEELPDPLAEHHVTEDRAAGGRTVTA